MEIWRHRPAYLMSLASSCKCFQVLPTRRKWSHTSRNITRSRCNIWNSNSRRELLIAGVVVSSASNLTVRASASAQMPQVPKTDLAEGLSISQVDVCSDEQCIPHDSFECGSRFSLPCLHVVPGHRARRVGMQVIKGCWQLSGGHGCEQSPPIAAILGQTMRIRFPTSGTVSGDPLKEVALLIQR